MMISARELQRCVDHFREHWGELHCEGSHRYKSMPDLATAIRYAARSEREDGKIESHQRRIGRVTLRKFERKLQAKRRRIQACNNFTSLHELIGLLRIDGIGELAVYDIAQRIGEYLGLIPDEVYLHAGAKDGARALGLKGKKLSKGDLPAPLRDLSADWVESFLCIYKGRLCGTGRMPKPKNTGCGKRSGGGRGIC